MSIDTLSALPAGILFAFVMTITPGPNNVMLLASGAHFGFRRTLPHVFGIGVGVVVLMLPVALGLGQAFIRFPMLYTVLEGASALYLLYLAWRIGTSGDVQSRSGPARPMRFHEAMLFQWSNPKAWMMVLAGATTVHIASDFTANAIWMAAVLYCVGLPCICIWAAFGTSMRRLLSKPASLRLFNLTMAAMLIGTLYPMAANVIAS